MTVRFRRPGALLGEFVDCFWYMDGYAAAHSRERALPTGTVELVVDLRDERMRIFKNDEDRAGQEFGGSLICGPQSGYFVLDTSQASAVAGVHFKPGGAAPFLGMPAGEITDQHVSLEEVWGRHARRLRERLLAAASPEAMFDLLEQALLERLTRPPLLHSAVTYALAKFAAAPSDSRVAGVRNYTGYGAKRFIELFRDSTGLTPKLYCRIRRFQDVIARVSAGRRVEWARVAADGGYSDQSHLNREFRDFAGVTPAEYHPIPERNPSHTAVLD